MIELLILACLLFLIKSDIEHPTSEILQSANLLNKY